MSQRFKLFIEYDGTHFSGWQKQPDVRTVEGVIESALSTLYQKEIDVVGQGRTDAGVHALQQIAHVDLPVLHSESRIIHAMRGLLPEDVTIYRVEKTNSEFHSRFDALSRKYRYRVANRPIPIDRHKTWYSFLDCDIKLLNECANIILGEHDFLHFCVPNDDPHLTTKCNIKESFWTKDTGIMTYTISGNRFLRQMVRRLVGTMVQVSAGRIELINFEQMIYGSIGSDPIFTAPSNGLTLESVDYGDES